MARRPFIGYCVAVLLLALVLPRDGLLVLAGVLLGQAAAGRIWKTPR